MEHCLYTTLLENPEGCWPNERSVLSGVQQQTSNDTNKVLGLGFDKDINKEINKEDDRVETVWEMQMNT